MKHRNFIRQSFLFLLVFSVTASSFAQGFSPAARARMQHVLDSFQTNPDTPVIGGIAAAISVDGLALWQGSSGYAARNVDGDNYLLPGGTPFGIDTLSRVYSVTKTFTAALTLDLANEGVFSLNDPVSKYLPLIAVYDTAINPAATIRQLLDHESGYSDYTTDIDFQIALAFDPTHIWNPYELASFATQLAPPGTERRYSSTNYVLLGAIIEAATGRLVEQLYRERYLDKLGLSSTYFGGRETIASCKKLASPHDNIAGFNPIFSLTGQPLFPDTITNISRFPYEGVVSSAFTAGAMVSNVLDLTKWGNALFGGRATSKATIDSMIGSIAPYPDEDGDYLGYGLFYNTQISTTDSFIGHDGNALGYRALMFYQPDRKMTIAIVTNSHNINPYAIGKALYAAMPGFLCGSAEQSVQVCFRGYSACIPRVAARFFIRKGAYLGSCGSTFIQNTDSLLTAELSRSELASLGISNEIKGEDKITVSPNPVRSRATLSFTTANSGNASVAVYDMNGRQVLLPYNGITQGGISRTINIDAGSLTAGVYMVVLQTTAGRATQKMIVVR